MRERAKALGIKVDGRWSESRLLEEIMRAESELKNGDMVDGAKVEILPSDVPVIEGADVAEEAVEPIPEPVVEPVDKFQTLEWANDRAAKIWEGQSSSLSTLERVGRIKLALKDKGFTDFTKLTLPTKLDYKKHL